MLKVPQYGALPAFALGFGRLQGKTPSFVPNYGRALVLFSNHGLDKDSDPDFSDLGIDMTIFAKSALFCNYCDLRADRRISQLSALGVDAVYAKAKELLPVARTPEQEQLLQFLISAHAPLGINEQLSFLTEAGNLKRLLSWNAKDTRLVIGPLVHWAGPISVAAYQAAAGVLVKAPDAIDKLQDALVKAVLQDHLKLTQVEDGKGSVHAVATHVASELAVVKLSCHSYAPADGVKAKVADLSREAVKAMVKVLGAPAKKLGEHDQTGVMTELLRVHQAILDKEKEEKEIERKRKAQEEEKLRKEDEERKRLKKEEDEKLCKQSEEEVSGASTKRRKNANQKVRMRPTVRMQRRQRGDRLRCKCKKRRRPQENYTRMIW